MSFFYRFVITAMVVLTPLALQAAAQPHTNFAGTSTPALVPASLSDLIRDYRADEQSVGHFYDLSWSELRFERLEKLYRDWLTRLAAVNFDVMDQGQRTDYVLLRNELERSLAGIARDRQRVAGMEQFLGFRKTINELERARWSGEAVNSQAAGSKLAEIGKQVKEIRERIESAKSAAGRSVGGRCSVSAHPGRGDDGASPSGLSDHQLSSQTRDEAKPGEKKDDPKKKNDSAPPITVEPAVALRVAGAVGELRGTLKRWFEFYGGFQPDFTWWVKAPYEETGKQLEEFAKYLREEVAGQKGKDEDPLVGEPVGAEALAEQIRFEFLPYSAKELIAIGERELAWCETEMKKAAREMGCGDDWKAAMAKVKADFVPPGEQDELVGKIARESLAFTKKHRFVSVPALCEETWRLTMMSPETLKTIPYAAYSSQNMMVAYAREDMKQDDKLMVMRGNNRAFTHLTVMHELIPGHHLQGFQAARHHQYRQEFGTPFYVEGWALYCELRFWDLGWARTPQERIGMLFWRMHRASRIIVSLKFHLGQMKPDEMVEFLVNRVGHERFGATSEVRRYISHNASPLYQAGYMIGGKQLVALHNELVPAQMTEQQFNDAVLAAGPVPIELLRAELRRLPLTRDAKSGWKFAADNP